MSQFGKTRSVIERYSDEAEDFKYGAKTHHWDGLNTNVNLRNNYVFFTGYDIVMLLRFCFSERFNKNENLDLNAAWALIRKQTFVHPMYTDLRLSGCSRNTVYGYWAPKKRLRKFFEQNLNRLKSKQPKEKKVLILEDTDFIRDRQAALQLLNS